MTLLGQFIVKNYPGMKLTYIAEQSGMTKQRLHYLMNSEASKLTFEEACRMGKVLNISLDILCGELSQARMNEKIMQIIGRNISGVEKVLGPMQNSESVTDKRATRNSESIKGFFGDGRYEIVFIDGVADWITINNTDALPAAEFIEAWGLEQIKPSFSNPDIVVRYYNLYGMKEIAVFKTVEGGIFYIYIKAFTE